MRKALKRFVGVTLLVGALVASIGGSAFAGNGHGTKAGGPNGNNTNYNTAHNTNDASCSNAWWCPA